MDATGDLRRCMLKGRLGLQTFLQLKVVMDRCRANSHPKQLRERSPFTQ